MENFRVSVSVGGSLFSCDPLFLGKSQPPYTSTTEQVKPTSHNHWTLIIRHGLFKWEIIDPSWRLDRTLLNGDRKGRQAPIARPASRLLLSSSSTSRLLNAVAHVEFYLVGECDANTRKTKHMRYRTSSRRFFSRFLYVFSIHQRPKQQQQPQHQQQSRCLVLNWYLLYALYGTLPRWRYWCCCLSLWVRWDALLSTRPEKGAWEIWGSSWQRVEIGLGRRVRVIKSQAVDDIIIIVVVVYYFK